MPAKFYYGDALALAQTFPDNYVTSIVTDPPYGLSFMGREWDHGVPGVLFWSEFLRISKPGAMLLAFGGTRTHHRLMGAIEDAGWELRDCLMWLYGQGMPKSFNKLWPGYGTALKPAFEPIILAMKPLDGTFKENAARHGVAGLNIDACRIPTDENLNGGAYAQEGNRQLSQSLRLGGTGMNAPGKTTGREFVQPTGRWPANVVHDGSPDIPESRFFYCAKTSAEERHAGCDHLLWKMEAEAQTPVSEVEWRSLSEKQQGKGNVHPTVKPLALLDWLCKLVCPPERGVLLDPFCGSGSTLLSGLKTFPNVVGFDNWSVASIVTSARLQAARGVGFDGSWGEFPFRVWN